MLSGRALAFVLLGWSLAKVLVGHLRRRPPGLELFERNYGPEGLDALAPAERLELSTFSGCVACGRCDGGEGERVTGAAGAYPGMMQLVLASTRSTTDFAAARRAFAHVPLRVLQQKVLECPARIPFVTLREFVEAHAAAHATAPEFVS